MSFLKVAECFSQNRHVWCGEISAGTVPEYGVFFVNMLRKSNIFTHTESKTLQFWCKYRSKAFKHGYVNLLFVGMVLKYRCA